MKDIFKVDVTLVENGVFPTEVGACLKWAFGDDAATLQINEWPGRWNKLHPDLWVMGKSDKFYTSVVRVARSWCKCRADAIKYWNEKQN